MKRIILLVLLVTVTVGISNCKEIEDHQNRHENRYVKRKMKSINQRMYEKYVTDYNFVMKNGDALDQEVAADMVRLTCIELRDAKCTAKWTKLAKEAKARR